MTKYSTVIKSLVSAAKQAEYPDPTCPTKGGLHWWILPHKDLIPLFQTLPQKIEEYRTLANSFFKANITLIPKPGKDIPQKKRQLEASISKEYRCKSPQENLSKSNSTIH